MTGIPSEELEPFAAKIIGNLFARCEAAADPHELYDACQKFWGAANALDRLAGCLRTNDGSTDGLHFVLAASNNVSKVSTYIKSKIGVEPLFSKDPAWTWCT